MKKHIKVAECFFRNVEYYSQEYICTLKMQKETLLIRKNECEERLKSRVTFKDHVFMFTLFAAIYKVWDMEKEFYSLPFINSPQVTLFLITVLLTILFIYDNTRLNRLIREKQNLEISIRSINYCLENNIYRKETDAENVPEKAETEETTE